MLIQNEVVKSIKKGNHLKQEILKDMNINMGRLSQAIMKLKKWDIIEARNTKLAGGIKAYYIKEDD